MSEKTVHVHLTNPRAEEFKLSYRPRNNDFGRIWVSCLEKALNSGLREHNRFSNFNLDPTNELQSHIQKLKVVIAELKTVHPEVNLPDFDPRKIQESVNELHTNFADSHLVTAKIADENKELWSEFNSRLHAIEITMQNKNNLRALSLPLARIDIPWKDQARVDISAEHYREFSLDTSFGTAYFSYPQVGRQIYEIYLARDKSVPKEHIQPARFFSADTTLWFGPEQISSPEQLEAIKNWYDQNLNLAEAIGLKWGSPQLSLGRVAVAELVDKPATEREKLNLIKEISRFDTVLNVALE